MYSGVELLIVLLLISLVCAFRGLTNAFSVSNIPLSEMTKEERKRLWDGICQIFIPFAITFLFYYLLCP